MKPFSHSKYFLFLLLGLGLMLGSTLRAQEAPPVPPAPAEADKPAAPPAPAVVTDEAKDVAAPAVVIEEKEPEMRELTGTEAPPAETAEKAETADQPSAGDEKPEQNNHRRNSERVSFGSNSTLTEGESAAAVISIFGSSTSAGEVQGEVVSILGGSRVEGGTVGGEVVSVLGNTYINGEVRGEVVTVLGNVELGPKAIVHGEVVCIGGQFKRAETAVLKGNIQNIAIAGRNFDFTALTTWFHECLLYGRPLAFHRDLWIFWCVALGLLGFYALIALIAPTGVNKCVETLEQRPGSSLLAALLTLLLTPVAYILLSLTLAIVVGFLLIPVLSLGLFCASLFGKIVMLAWLGKRFTRLLGDGPLAHPVFGVLIGGLLVLGLYTVPVAGFIIYKLLGILGLGVVVYTIILQIKASRPPKPVKPVAAAVPAAPMATAPAAPMAVVASGAVSESVGVPPTSAEAAPPPVTPQMGAVLPVISAVTLPRAGFWIRVAASFLDCILLGIVTAMSSSLLHGWLTPGGSLPFWFAVYCVVMWVTKGTTIGGIICGLKVVRVDDRPLDWGVGVVRALGGFLSLAVAGLGFIWVAFDDEKQSWHDKIAGTTIVKVPKGTALL
ncbi:RDD family protein [Oleiharenicola lentus]|jgi:uncharacterized RDD family membrane protein YckC/cytoskeletal protein CcmA (bactofilin family)|nr:RDD family protein [Oleiharenicola lentus]